MKHFLLVILLSTLTQFVTANDEEDTITDQQRCEEWAEMDGIDSDKKAEYIAECLSNLQYDDGMNDDSYVDE
jgi:hypothetical protein